MDLEAYFRRNPKAAYIDSQSLRAHASSMNNVREAQLFHSYDVRFFKPLYTKPTFTTVDAKMLEPIFEQAMRDGLVAKRRYVPISDTAANMSAPFAAFDMLYAYGALLMIV